MARANPIMAVPAAAMREPSCATTFTAAFYVLLMGAESCKYFLLAHIALSPSLALFKGSGSRFQDGGEPDRDFRLHFTSAVQEPNPFGDWSRPLQPRAQIGFTAASLALHQRHGPTLPFAI